MMKYVVNITDDALADMEDIYNYIAYELLAPENARGQYDRIADAILTLDSFPERFKVFDVEPEHSLRIRRMVVWTARRMPCRLFHEVRAGMAR